MDRLPNIGIVSNANGTLCAHFERLGLARSVDCVIDSADEGVEKPDPRIFERALERLGAGAAGLHAMLFDPLDLYADQPCPRVRSLDMLAERLEDAAGR